MSVIPIGRVVGELAARDPDRPLLTCGDRTVTRGAFDRTTNRVARTFAGRGVEQDDTVVVGLPNGIEFYEACVAAWKLGATPLPVSWRLPERERDEIVALAAPALVVTAPVAPDPATSDEPLPERVASRLRAMTSGGSTGRPKLILSEGPGAFDPDSRPYGMQPHHVRLVPGPLYHTAPFSSTSGMLLGQHVIVMERFDPVAALDAIQRHRVNYVQFVPTMLLRMWRVLEADPSAYDLSSLEQVWHMGAPCPAWLKEAWIDLLGPAKVFELYGGTESQAMTCITGEEWLAHRGSVGRPVRGEIKVVDAEGNEAPPGDVGEIFMRPGPDAAPTYRYVGSEARTLPGGWESLGDLGWMDADGYLYIADRRTDMIVSGGANVYPAEVEAALSEHPAVLSCAVVGLPDDDLGRRVHAVVQATAAVDEDELRAFVATRLVRYKAPRSFRFVSEPLRDDAGKVRRSAVLDAEVARLGLETGA